ncbi:MAG TPA: hypothetical protein VFP86_07030 [bacterium]|nr:hypothetical protein [bacterium]
MTTAELDKKIAALLFVLFSILYVSTVTKGDDGYNGASRLALVQAIVEQHTFSIDQSLYTPLTKDRAYVRGHYYTDKAPGQSLSAVPLYWVLYHLGISFAKHRGIAEELLKIPFALLAALVPMLFFAISKSYAPKQRVRLLVALALGAGTGIFFLSGVFFSHASAAAFLLISFYFTLRARENTNWFWLSGAAGGTAFFFEYPALFLAIAIHLNYLSQQRRMEIGKAILAALPFVVCVLALNFQITGNPLDFPYYHTGDWPGSPLPVNSNRFELGHVTFQYAAQMFFFGQSFPRAHNYDNYFQGLFLYSPFLLLGLFFSRKEHVILLLGCLAVALLYLGSVVDDAVGGCTFSNRYLVITLPFLALPALQLVQHWPKAFAIAAGASIAMNFIGATTVPLSCARFPLGEAITYLPAYLPALLRHAAMLSAFAIIPFVFFPSIARKGEEVIRVLSARS